MKISKFKSAVLAVILALLRAGKAEPGYIYEPPNNNFPALPQENFAPNNGYYYPPPSVLQPDLSQQNFGGYFYPRPPSRLPPLSAENVNYETSNDTTAGSQMPIVMGDFIDDIINQQKEQILTSLLGNSDAASAYGDDDDSKVTKFNKCASCTCGVPNVNRIVGGTVVPFNKYPWTAQLLKGDLVYCGGTLINDRYVLTAAHCIYGQSAKSLSVRLLQLNRSTNNMGITRRVKSLLMHSKYNVHTLVNDIALVGMYKPIELFDPMRPVCLPSRWNQNFDFKEGVVAGWGLTSEDGMASSVLREVAVPIITNTQCRATSYKSMITDTMLCAGLVEKGGKDACQGDSGGPLAVRERVFQLAGVVSFGYGCAKPNAPGIYTRVSRYLEWISTNTKDACYCTK
ncbi:trypsin-1 [Eurosta solidaginis]|uniref:trypsin-1 n=1 Tax=Eurosta solidaginis TaxID=178769 RepID=UPI003530A514